LPEVRVEGVDADSLEEVLEALRSWGAPEFTRGAGDGDYVVLVPSSGKGSDAIRLCAFLMELPNASLRPEAASPHFLSRRKRSSESA
jgi:hypothetical protein